MNNTRKMETKVLFFLIQLLLCLITSSADTTDTSEMNFRISQEDYTGLIRRIRDLESHYRIYERDKLTCRGYYVALIDAKDKISELNQEITTLKSNHDLLKIEMKHNYELVKQELTNLSNQQGTKADVLLLDRKVTHLQGEVQRLALLDLSPLRGQKGGKGEPGSQGIKGEKGTHGVKGEHGLLGMKGETGHKGERGFPGPKGNNGLPGVNGQKGDKGETDETVIRDVHQLKHNMQDVNITFWNLTDSVQELWKTTIPLVSVKVLPSVTLVFFNQSAELRCVVNGSLSRTFRWLQDGTVLDGVTNEYYNTKQATTGSNKYKCEVFTPAGWITSDEATVSNIATDCLEIYDSNIRTNGIYRISPDNITIFNVYCDMEAGGWTVIQQRIHGDVIFTRGWNDYVNGFGNLNGDFWLGLDYIHKLTNPPVEVMIEGVTRDTNESVWERYNRFTVGGATTYYTMNVNVTGTYNTVAQRLGYDFKNGFGYHNGARFGTYAGTGKYYCSKTYGNAGWWYKKCWVVLINNQYNKMSMRAGWGGGSEVEGIITRSKMKIRRT